MLVSYFEKEPTLLRAVTQTLSCLNNSPYWVTHSLSPGTINVLILQCFQRSKLPKIYNI